MTAIENITIDHAAAENGLGVGGLKVISASQLAWTPPGGTQGTAVTIANGETKVLEGGSAPDKYLRVSRTAAAALVGSEGVELFDVFNNVIGLDNVSDAEATAGDTEYRALFLKNENAAPTTAAFLWVSALTTAETSSVAQLPGAGAGTIEFAAGSLQAWRPRGFARIRTSGGSLREIVYYSSRTDAVLTVAAADRALLGTSAGAGAATDTVLGVPGNRIAKDTPVANAITDKTGAGEGSQPAGLTWETGTANAISLGVIAAGGLMGLWIERAVPVGMIADPNMEVEIGYSFTIGGTTWTGRLWGRYRVANDALARFELFKGVGGAPDFDAAAFHTYQSVPSVVALPNGVHHFVRRRRNKFNVLSNNRDEVVMSITAGVEDAVPPTAPSAIQVAGVVGGKFKVQAFYNEAWDAAAADAFVVFYEVDGTTPDPDLDSPKATVAFTAGVALQVLDWTVATAQVDQAPVKAIVRTRRSAAAVDSENTAITTYTINAVGPIKPPVGLMVADPRSAFRQVPTIGAASNYVVDAGNNIRFDVSVGRVDFYGDTFLIWTVIFDSCIPGLSNFMYIPSDWILDQVTGFAGGGTADAIEVISWTAGDKRLGVNVNGTREMLIDVTNKTIFYTTRNQVDAPAGTTAPAAVLPRFADTVFLVYDAEGEDFVPYSSIDGAGDWRLAVSVDQTITQAQIEAL